MPDVDPKIRRRTRAYELGAYLLIVGVALYGFNKLEGATSEAEKAGEDASNAVEKVEDQADTNTRVVDCLITYATDLTVSLQERDGVARTARDAQSELWATLRRLTENPGTPNGTEIFLNSIKRYQAILHRLNQTASINPYPDITGCLLEDIVPQDPQPDPAVYELVALLAPATCFGHRIEIRGTERDDVLVGTDGNDVIKSFRGDDIIFAGGGNDTLCGGQGNDTINGGRDRDRARGQKGYDFCLQTEETRSC